MELYKRIRPRAFKMMVGQDTAASQLNDWVKNDKVPHASLFIGPSGCGKTTAARILSVRVGCGPGDLHEMNAADCKGIDEIRAIDRNMRMSPLSGKCLVWIVDECHMLTSQAQESFLKPLEDTPSHVYFILCSSKPGKLIEAVRNRCSIVEFKKIALTDIISLLDIIIEKESIKVGGEVVDLIAQVSEGSARKALVLLEQVMTISDEEKQIEIVRSSQADRSAFDLCKMLINPRVQWAEVARFLKEIEDEPEGLRRMVLGYASKCCLGGGKSAVRGNMIISFFRDNWYDCGKAGLVNACFEVVHCK